MMARISKRTAPRRPYGGRMTEKETPSRGVTGTFTTDGRPHGMTSLTPFLALTDAAGAIELVASRFRCKRAGLGSGFVGLMLRGGGDSVGLVGVVDGVSGS